MNRRKFVGGYLGAALSLVLTGCSALSQNKQVVRIERVTLANFGEEKEKQLSVTISYDGDVIHDKTHTIPPKENRIAGTVRITNFPDEAGEYTIKASLANKSKTKTVDVSPPESRTCVNFDIQVFDDGKIGVLPRKCDTTD